MGNRPHSATVKTGTEPGLTAKSSGVRRSVAQSMLRRRFSSRSGEDLRDKAVLTCRLDVERPRVDVSGRTLRCCRNDIHGVCSLR